MDPTGPPPRPLLNDSAFVGVAALVGGAYVALVLLMVVADLAYMTPASLSAALKSPEVRYAAWLSRWSATVSAALGVVVATPLAYLLARAAKESQSRMSRVAVAAVDAVLDIPLVLPPLVVGVSLLVLFRFAPAVWLAPWVVYEVPAVVLAQLVVAAALAVRTLRAAFEQASRILASGSTRVTSPSASIRERYGSDEAGRKRSPRPERRVWVSSEPLGPYCNAMVRPLSAW